jgi:hypothetical protein
MGHCVFNADNGRRARGDGRHGNHEAQGQGGQAPERYGAQGRGGQGRGRDDEAPPGIPGLPQRRRQGAQGEEERQGPGGRHENAKDKNRKGHNAFMAAYTLRKRLLAA